MCCSQTLFLSLPVDSIGCYLFHARLALISSDRCYPFKLLLVWLCIWVRMKIFIKTRAESKSFDADFWFSWLLLVVRLLCPRVLCRWLNQHWEGPVRSCSEAVISNQPLQPSLASWWVTFQLTSESCSTTSVKGGQPLWRSLLCLEMSFQLCLACLQNGWVAQDEEKRKEILSLPTWSFLLGNVNQWKLQHLMHVEAPACRCGNLELSPTSNFPLLSGERCGHQGMVHPNLLSRRSWVNHCLEVPLSVRWLRGHPECH